MNKKFVLVLPLLFQFFELNAQTPLFAVDPTNARFVIKKEFPENCSLCYLQEGQVFFREKDLDKNLAYCIVRTDYGRREIYEGRRMRLQSINGYEPIIINGAHAINRNWNTTMITGNAPVDYEWSISCSSKKGEGREISKEELIRTLGGALEFSAPVTLDYDLQITNTFSQFPVGTKIEFKANLNSSMTGWSNHIMLFTEGNVSSKWEEGAFCYTRGWGEHSVNTNDSFTIQTLDFSYEHSSGLLRNTGTYYHLKFNNNSLTSATQFTCSSSNKGSAFKRPSISEFKEAVGPLVDFKLP